MAAGCRQDKETEEDRPGGRSLQRNGKGDTGRRCFEEAHPQAQREVVGSNPALPSTVVWDVSHGPFSVKAAVCKERLPFADGLRLECRQGEEGCARTLEIATASVRTGFAMTGLGGSGPR